MAFLKFNKSELVNLSYSLKREIICANKTGAYCNTSIAACNTRRYHGLLAVPVAAFGGNEHLLLSSLDESLVLNGKQFNLGIHRYGDVYDPRGHKYIVDFEADPVPKITYKVGEIVFEKTILLVPDKDQVMIKFSLIEAPAKVKLMLKPFLAFRDIHALTSENSLACTQGWSVPNGMAYKLYEGFPALNLQFNSKDVHFVEAGTWFKNLTYSDEARRGFACTEDLYVPGRFETVLAPGDSIVFSASVEAVKTTQIKKQFETYLAETTPITNYHDQLVHCARLLLQDRNNHKTISAGFSWMKSGLLRESLLSVFGLTLCAGGTKAEFEDVLDNLLQDNQERLFHRTTQVEAPLFLGDLLNSYIAYGASPKHVWEKYGETLKGIIRSYLPGVRKEIAMQPNGLLWAQKENTALTWMNAYIDGKPVTERAGYQIEVNSFWYSAICFALEMEAKYPSKEDDFVKIFSPLPEQIRTSFKDAFWDPNRGYLADYVDNNGGHFEVRPCMLFALTGKYPIVDDEIASSVLHVIDSELVTQRGLRTLSPRDFAYKGVYEGTQTERDLAYHNGTNWPALLGAYVEVSLKLKGPSFLNKAKWLTEGFFEDLNKHGVGAFSELYDGDPPYEAHGAISSALSTSALLMVDYFIAKYKEDVL